MPINNHCPCCESPKFTVFYELEQVPVHSVLLLPTRKEALKFPKRDIVLSLCENCGFIWNLAFNPNLQHFSDKYEETQGFSSTFNLFHQHLAERLIENHNLNGKDIIEIGCGKGEFLTLLCELGKNRGVGFDPAYVSGRVHQIDHNSSDVDQRLTFITDFYSEKYSDYYGDFVCCKMTLEHIQDTGNFLKMVRRSIGDRPETVIFFQVPDMNRVLKDFAFWEIYYEHCSYFTPGSLATLFQRCNFNVTDIGTDYDDQYLMIEAKPSQNGEGTLLIDVDLDLKTLKEDVANFTKNCTHQITKWRDKLAQIKEKRQRVVIWGAGSKGVSFLTTLKIGGEIEYAVDINPHKHGTFMAGTGQEIVAPEFLQDYQPDVVIVMNPIYCEEIQRDLDRLGVKAELMPV